MHRFLPATFLFSVLLFSSAGAANLTGKATFSGKVPKAAPIDMSSAPECKKAHQGPVPKEEIIANEGGLANVFVYVKDGLKPEQKPKDTPAPVTLGQSGCLYVPRVMGMQVGQTLRIVNSDPTFHNVNAAAKQNPRLNVGSFKDKVVEKKFDKPEVMIKVKCDVHNWMTGYIGVLDHPFFAVTDPKGNFIIAGLPAGEYTLEAWHEKLGMQTAKVTVEEGKAATTTFAFASK